MLLLCPVKVQEVVDGECKAITPEAFRVDPDGISVTWKEYFTEPPEAIQQAAMEMKKARKPSRSGVLAQANVGRILEVATKLQLAAKVTHTPIDENRAHASITGWDPDRGALLALTFAFRPPFVPNKSIPGFCDKVNAAQGG